jgi:hypothetical protein
MRVIFDNVEAAIEGFDASFQASAKYVMDASGLREQHSKLKSLQLSFVFMLSICPPQATATLRPSDTASISSVATTSLLSGNGVFEGTIEQFPVYSTIQGSTDKEPITYRATLTLHPAKGNPALPAGKPESTSSSSPSTGGTHAPPDFTEQLSSLRRDQRLKKKLANLTSNPFFSKDSFGAYFGHSASAAKPETRMGVDPRMAVPAEVPGAINSGTAATTYLGVEPDYESEAWPIIYEETEAVEEDEEADFGSRLAAESNKDADDILAYVSSPAI